jgi:cellulose synthase/poly-beta-1,6-N-acetylglucosamine synthase-like glycosyltransferase
MSSTILLLTYGIFYFKIYKNEKRAKEYLIFLGKKLYNEDEKPVSIIISVYNEEEVIGRKIEDVSKLDYPKDKIELIVLDDNSKDKTYERAKVAIKDHNLNGRIIKNQTRLGLNESLNIAIDSAKNDIICLTDSDVLLDENSLKYCVSILNNVRDVGGVTGKIVPIHQNINQITSVEDTYRDITNTANLVESYYHSTFPGSGVLLVFKRSALSGPIPNDSGSTDGNISLNIVKTNNRYLYVPQAIVYEPVPENLKQQRLQKVRRARRIIEAIENNMQILFNRRYGKFGTLIFPLKFFMYMVCPLLFVVSYVSILILLLPILELLAIYLLLSLSIVLLSLMNNKVGNFTRSFLIHQVYLIQGLYGSFRKNKYWNKIERKNLSPAEMNG